MYMYTQSPGRGPSKAQGGAPPGPKSFKYRGIFEACNCLPIRGVL